MLVIKCEDLPLLWPSQRSCRNLNRSLVNSSFWRTLEPSLTAKKKKKKGISFLWSEVREKGAYITDRQILLHIFSDRALACRLLDKLYSVRESNGLCCITINHVNKQYQLLWMKRTLQIFVNTASEKIRDHYNIISYSDFYLFYNYVFEENENFSFIS